MLAAVRALVTGMALTLVFSFYRASRIMRGIPFVRTCWLCNLFCEPFTSPARAGAVASDAFYVLFPFCLAPHRHFVSDGALCPPLRVVA